MAQGHEILAVELYKDNKSSSSLEGNVMMLSVQSSVVGWMPVHMP